jgi:hypothetical protein
MGPFSPRGREKKGALPFLSHWERRGPIDALRAAMGSEGTAPTRG